MVLPYYRSALFLFPCSAICCTFFVSNFLHRKVPASVLVSFISFFLVFNFLTHLNFSSVKDYKSQSDAKESFDLLEKVGAKNVGIDPELFGVYRNYYAILKNKPYSFLGKQTGKNNSIEGSEYLVIVPPYKFNRHVSHKTTFTTLCFFPETGTIVLKIEK